MVELQNRGISDLTPDPAFGKEMTGYYRATYNSDENIKTKVSRFFFIREHLKHCHGLQDVLLLQRK
jgi:hypothetical protein